MFAILYFVFSEFIRLGDAIEHYPVYLLVGIVLWNFFVEVTTGSITAIVGKGDLIRKLSFPRYIIILSTCASALINLAFNVVVIGIVMLVAGTTIDVSKLYLLLPLLGELTIIAAGFAFLLSALYVRLRDVGYIWEVLMQAAFYLTPIIYPLVVAPQAIQKYLLLNPVGQAIQDIRHIVVTPQSTVIGDLWNPLVWLLPITFSIGIGIVGGLFFRQRSKSFAEDV